ncbi:MAG: hypothetical protein A2047_02005 [Omnitrophica bacterium GWA2_41_15]|nr:MAG: hypothetical protein A2047_02005 [Omnitrophica bacterium GWA2_41_15]
MDSPTVVDIFCGIGGISRGFKNTGYKILLGIDSNEHATNIFRKHHPEAEVIVDDVKNVDADRIRNIIGDVKINVLVGGPPCQGFSLAGRRKHDDSRNTLFYEFVRLANELKPSWILMENVRGLASARMPDGSSAIESVYRAFKPYFKLKHFFVNAADFGVPQKRKRIIFVGSSEKTDFDFQLPQMKWKPVGSVLINKNKVDKKYFYSKKLITGFKRRERINKKRGVGFRWQFLRINESSYTIPARYYKDGANALVKYPNGSIRMLTEKECAKIQGLSPRLFGKGKSDYIAIGNAVPPQIVEPFAKQILLHNSKNS